MKELKEFTVERLEKVANTPEKYDHRYLDNQLTASEARALAKIALAAKRVRTGRSQCVKCGGEGVMDSGGAQPWGEPISIECDCTTPPLNHAEQHMVVPDGWIKCSEKTPEEGGRYWCYVEEQNSLGKSHYQWNCSWNGDCWSDDALSGRVTHWMHLAAAPKPESELCTIFSQ